jgi:cobalamin biosynthesis protein CobW
VTSRIPVTIVTGFLGAGKTTLLSNLVKHTGDRKLAILVNEFGEISIDGALLRSERIEDGYEIHDLTNGLVAYSEDDQFLPTMQAICARRHSIDHVLIETSGLALPTAVMEALESEKLASDFVLDATLAVVDTPLMLANAFADTAETGNDTASDAARSIASLFEQQLEFADVVVLNKIDALDEDILLQAEDYVRRKAPGVRFLELAYQAKLDVRLTLGLRLHEAGAGKAGHYHFTPLQSLPGAGDSPLRDQRRLDGHAHSGLAAHVHGLSTHKHFHEQDPGWQSFVLKCKQEQDIDLLRQALVEVTQNQPILRLKGFASDKASGHLVVMQGVRSRVEAYPESDTATGARIVFIGYHPSRNQIATLLRERTGCDWK